MTATSGIKNFIGVCPGGDDDRVRAPKFLARKVDLMLVLLD